MVSEKLLTNSQANRFGKTFRFRIDKTVENQKIN